MHATFAAKAAFVLTVSCSVLGGWRGRRPQVVAGFRQAPPAEEEEQPEKGQEEQQEEEELQEIVVKRV